MKGQRLSFSSHKANGVNEMTVSFQKSEVEESERGEKKGVGAAKLPEPRVEKFVKMMALGTEVLPHRGK